MDYEEILKRMLNKVPEEIDKREGSIIYNALAPGALELATMYFELQNSIDLIFVDTAVNEYLDRICEQNGLKRREATKEIRKGLFYNENDELIDVDIGSRYSADLITYKVIEKMETGIYKLECETAGTVKNTTEQLIPINYIKGLAKAILSNILIPSEDVETDEELRQRFYEKINEKNFAGNIADYKKKTKELQGIGAVKVTPVWNGGGTVKLTILDSNFNKASDVLIENTQKEICPGITDTGIGIAPIGHKVTVVTVDEVTMNLSVELTITENSNIEIIKEEIISMLNEYLLELRKTWENTEKIVIRKSQIESRILDITGVLDIANTKLNGEKANIMLEENQIPVQGEVQVA